VLFLGLWQGTFVNIQVPDGFVEVVVVRMSLTLVSQQNAHAWRRVEPIPDGASPRCPIRPVRMMHVPLWLGASESISSCRWSFSSLALRFHGDGVVIN
jgi:hypothetical protein